MTFWLYQPTNIIKPTSWLVYKNQDWGDFLNFLTIILAGLVVYLRKNNMQGDLWKRLFVYGLFAIVLMGLFTSNESKVETIDGIEVPKLNDYQFSLSVD